MAAPADFTISDLRGGVNNSDSKFLLRPNELRDARNIDLRDGALGTKRNGSLGIDMDSSVFDSPIIATFTHTPTNNIGNDELWALDENGNLDRRVGGTWQGGVPVANDFVVINADNFNANAASLHSKLFIAAQGSEDRLLVWDGTVLRWAGIAQPPAPTVADTAPGGTYASTRYIRIRYTQQVSGVTVRRSEPSDVVAFVPLGSKTGATVTKPAGTEVSTSVRAEGQTHWEVEFSLDNILFYVVATVAIGTSTYTDTTDAGTGYSSFPLSENIGEYAVPGSAVHVSVDEDRIIMAGSYFVEGDGATVWWTPVNDDDGVGNDERIPVATKQRLSFDGLDGGPITALVAGVSGGIYPFKRKRIHKMVRTGILNAAYDPVTESTSRGSTMRGAVAGLDEGGLPCVYFTDESKGLCRIGQRGVEDGLARSIEKTWKRRNKNATIPSRVIHYPELDQVWVAVALDDADTPSMLFVHETQYGANFFFDGLPARARCFTLFPGADLTQRPVFGTDAEDLALGGTSYLHFGDVGATDNGAVYQAYGITRPYMLGGLFQKFGLLAAILVAAASDATLLVRLIRNFGVEQLDRFVSLLPTSDEEDVIRTLDDASLSDLNVVEIRFGDVAPSAQTWSLDQITFRPRREEGSA